MANTHFGACTFCKKESVIYANNVCRACSRKRAREYSEKNRLAGLCISCGSVRENPLRSKCQTCRDRIVKRGKEIGVCRDCGVEKEIYRSAHICSACSNERGRKRHLQNRLNGDCRCGKPKPSTQILCDVCVYRRKTYRQERGRVRTMEYCQRNKARLLSQQKERTRKQKIAVLTAYGGLICACCGETHLEFLSLNHLNGGGNQHRKEVKNLYRWLIKNNFPPGYNVLCMNCNFADGKAEGGCPHVRERAERQAALSPAI